MLGLAERAYFVLCLGLGWLLRAGRYAEAHIAHENRARRVRKRRRAYAPLLVWLGGPLVRILDTGVRVLPQREWEERERDMYLRLYGAAVRVEAGGTLVLPCLPGATLASLLERPDVEEALRTRAIEWATAALAALHRMGITHGDAMAENVLVDVDAGVARWFDFETVHEAGRPGVWRRADDVRALLATCLRRTAPDRRPTTLRLILDAYEDDEVTRVLARSFASAWRRPLPFHLGQAPLSYAAFGEIDRLLRARVGG